MSCNRFLFDTICDPDIRNLNDGAKKLQISRGLLRSRLIEAHLPVRWPQLRRICENLRGQLSPPPPVYNIYQKSVRDNSLLDDRALELLTPVANYHFDHTMLILTRFSIMGPDRRASLTSQWFSSPPISPADWHLQYFPDAPAQAFRSQMNSFFQDLPPCLKSLTNDELFQVNSQLSVAFLFGTVTFPEPGIASPHLKGGFLLGLRANGTGYLTIDQATPTPIARDKWHDILTWFRSHNPLYENVEPITPQNVDLRLDPVIHSSAVAAAELPTPTRLTDGTNVRIAIKNSDGTSRSKYVPLELALALTFPALFPFGVPPIPGPTWRAKAKLILASHPYYRSGRLQCHLALFLYHLIQDAALSFERARLSLQPITVPEGTNRVIPSNLFLHDPSSSAYWSARQAEVRGMCREFGDPDLMITFTFVNKWPEVQAVEDANRRLMGFPLDIRFSPVETMLIWKTHFTDVKRDGFSHLIKSLGFGTVAHFIWRLEFQARGAPHVHSLIWLTDRLPLATVQSTLFGSKPGPDFPILNNLVTSTMVHQCNISRCKRGDASNPCKYGFPKPVCQEAYVTETGAIQLPRLPPDQWVVDYSPAFLLKWRGHCHVHVLRTAEHPETSPNAIFYITKYNFKPEPSLRVEARTADSFEQLTHARIVSSEEAVSRIFSYDYYGSDTRCDFLSLKPPESRSAAFVNGQQVQVPAVEKYFLRPAALERLPILGFFSLYDISCSSQTHGDFAAHNPQLSTDWHALLSVHEQRPAQSLKDATWETQHLTPLTLIHDASLFPALALPSALSLRCTLRVAPRIILTDKFSLCSDPDAIAYAWLLLNGSWRSDDEMRAGCDSWTDALIHHGLAPDVHFTRHPVYCRLIDYMLASCRYSESDIATTISRMDEDMSPYLESLARTSGPQLTATLTSLLGILRQRHAAQQETVATLSPPDFARARSFIACDFTEPERRAAAERFAAASRRLNNDQRAVLDHLTTRLDSGVIVNLFVRGKAGTGKSFLISCIQDLLTSRQIPYITCASTGIAASLIHGQTVHSAFAMFTTSTGETVSSLNIARPNGYAVSLASLLIIDETTMISRSVLTCLDMTLRRLAAQTLSPNYDQPFGGKHVLLFGDLAQVPAVVRTADDFAESAEQFFASHPYSSFTTMSLSIIMRQDPDQEQLLQLLDEVRASTHLSDSSLTALRSRFYPGPLETVVDAVDAFVGHDLPSGMVIAFSNARVSRYNQLIINRRSTALQVTPVTYHAQFFVTDSCSYRASPDRQNPLPTPPRPFSVTVASEAERRLLFGAFRAGHFNTIIPFSLDLIPGARVMLLQNLDIQSGLINGARGTYIGPVSDDDALEVSFDCQPPGSPPTLVTRTRSVSYGLANGKQIFVYQFPLKLCWAVTAHKSQGQSLTRVAVDISERAFAHGAFYVALSRVRRLDNLLLFGLDAFPTDGPLYHINNYIQYYDRQPTLTDAYSHAPTHPQ